MHVHYHAAVMPGPNEVAIAFLGELPSLATCDVTPAATSNVNIMRETNLDSQIDIGRGMRDIGIKLLPAILKRRPVIGTAIERATAY